MNSDPVKANGTPFRGQLQDKWSALTDDDLEAIGAKTDQLAGKLQERYGYGKEQADREAEEFVRLHPEANGGVNPGITQIARLPAPPPPVHREESPPAAPPSSARASLPPIQDDHALTNRPQAPSPPAVGYAHTATIWISPRVLQWVAPVVVVALVVFLFLPWTGAYPGGYGVFKQNAFQTIWGGVTVDPVGAKALDSVKPYDSVEANGLMLFYTLFVLLALILVLAPLAPTFSSFQSLPPIIRSLWRRRLEMLGAVALGAFILLLIQLGRDFGLEAAVAAKVDKALAGELRAARTPTEQEMASINRGLQLGPFNLGRTLWLRLAVFSHVLLLAGLGLELWLKRRGTRPLPRIQWQT